VRSININTLRLQKHVGLDIRDAVILYKQYSGLITDVPTGNSVVVAGDATTLFIINDYAVLPLTEFEIERQVTTITYTALTDTTEIVLTGTAALSVDEIGATIAKKYAVSDKLTLNGISSVDQKIESASLFEFDSGEITIVFDNKDGYFFNKTDTGLFNNFDGVFWVKYMLYVVGSSDNWTIYFAGIVTDLTDTMPNPYDKTFRIKAFGHTFELGRYPAYNVIDTAHTDLPKIGGINILKYEPSSESSTGIKQISYKPFDNTRLDGVDIERVSGGTKSGIKILEYRYPHYFRWDNGAWVQIAVISDTINSEGTQQLFDNGGTEYAIVKFGDANGLNDYPDSNVEIWVNIKDSDKNDGDSKAINNQGGPTITFDNGTATAIMIHFLAIVTDDGTLTEISDISNVPINADYTSVAILAADTDKLYIFSDSIFWGIKFDLGTLFTASDIEFRYSTGGNTFMSSVMTSIQNGLVDNTAGFTSKDDPTIRWSSATNWTKNTVLIGNVEYKGYAIEIKRVTATGALELKEIRRIIRVRGIDNDFIEIDFNQSLLTRKNTDDELIIKLDKAGNYAFGGWHENIPVRALLESALNEAFYYSNKRILSDTKLLLSEKTFNIWGKSPRHNYERNPSALVVDYTSQYVYIAVGLELWRCYFDGKWEYITEIIPYTMGSYKYTVEDIWIDGTKIFLDVQHKDIKFATIFSMIYSYDQSNDTATLENGTGFIATNLYDGKRSIRNGGQLSLSGGVNFRAIGQYEITSIYGTIGYCGENICVPFPQTLHVKLNAASGVDDPIFLYDMPDLYTILFHAGFIRPEWIFSLGNYYNIVQPNLDKQGELYVSSAGYYCLQQGTLTGGNQTGISAPIPKLELKIDYGQQGNTFRKSTGEFYSFKLQVDPTLNNYYRMYDVIGDSFIDIEYVNESTLPICNAIDEANNYIYFGHTNWIDKGVYTTDNAVSLSYITKVALSGNRIINADAVMYWSGAGYSDITVEANNDNNLASYPLNNPLDAMYIGNSDKFRSIKFDVPAGVYAIQYYNGTAWVAVPNATHPNFPNGIASFDIPNNWAEVSVNGSASLYYIRVILASGSAVVNTIGITEVVLWDSYENTAGAESHLMPIWLCLADSDTLHGTFFNKSSDSGVSPFQWQYFVYDLLNPTTGMNTTIIAGNNFEYDTTALFKNHKYAKDENVVYFISQNIRYKDKPSALLRATYDRINDEITIDNLGVIDVEDWGAQTQITCNDTGHLFGITKDVNFILWEYAKEFYPRIELAAFSESDSIRNILQFVNQMMNYYYIIHDERKIRIARRGVTNGNIQLSFNENVARSTPGIGYWKHYYDAISVKYANPFNKNTGDRKIGFDGWMKRVLKIDNPLVQNKYIAQIIAEVQYEYYHKYRLAIETLKLLPLFHIECMDKFNLLLNPRDVDLDSTTDFITTSAKLESDKSVIISGIEI